MLFVVFVGYPENENGSIFSCTWVVYVFVVYLKIVARYMLLCLVKTRLCFVFSECGSLGARLTWIGVNAVAPHIAYVRHGDSK